MKFLETKRKTPVFPSEHSKKTHARRGVISELLQEHGGSRKRSEQKDDENSLRPPHLSLLYVTKKKEEYVCM